jgi:hypothetical protein
MVQRLEQLARKVQCLGTYSNTMVMITEYRHAGNAACQKQSAKRSVGRAFTGRRAGDIFETCVEAKGNLGYTTTWAPCVVHPVRSWKNVAEVKKTIRTNSLSSQKLGIKQGDEINTIKT